MGDQKLRLVVDPRGHGTRVFIDDHEINGLQAVHLQVFLDGNRLTLTFAPTSVEVEGAVAEIHEERR